VCSSDLMQKIFFNLALLLDCQVVINFIKKTHKKNLELVRGFFYA